uniref:Uncharacterized protein n=1 Tax=Glossina morsitans morsitans TaxID=37546 RepID=A0A1B0GFU2_GLOMM
MLISSLLVAISRSLLVRAFIVICNTKPYEFSPNSEMGRVINSYSLKPFSAAKR